MHKTIDLGNSRMSTTNKIQLSEQHPKKNFCFPATPPPSLLVHPPVSAANEGSLQRPDSLAVQAFSTVRAQSILCKKREESKEWTQLITGYSFTFHNEEGEKRFFFFF